MLKDTYARYLNLLQEKRARYSGQTTGCGERWSPYLIPVHGKNVRGRAFADLILLIQQDNFIEPALVRLLVPGQVLGPGSHFRSSKWRSTVAAVRHVCKPHTLRPPVQVRRERNQISIAGDIRRLE